MADGVMIAVIAGIAGITGIAIGAWLTTQRERWNLRRELYTRLLENLGEAADALELLYDAALAGPGRDEKAKNQWDIRISKLTERESRAEEGIRRATSVAAIMLNDEAIKALKSLQKEWNLSGQVESMGEHVFIRLNAVRKAYNVLVAAAKNDLGFKRPGNVPESFLDFRETR
jgi:hypothetical protein